MSLGSGVARGEREVQSCLRSIVGLHGLFCVLIHEDASALDSKHGDAQACQVQCAVAFGVSILGQVPGREDQDKGERPFEEVPAAFHQGFKTNAFHIRGQAAGFDAAVPPPAAAEELVHCMENRS